MFLMAGTPMLVTRAPNTRALLVPRTWELENMLWFLQEQDTFFTSDNSNAAFHKKQDLKKFRPQTTLLPSVN